MTDATERFTARTIRQVKGDGSVKLRELSIPSDETKQEHRKMLRLLYSFGIPMPHATGAVPGKELLDNVRPHQQSSFFYKVDLKNAFPSVDLPTLLSTLKTPIVPKRHETAVHGMVAELAEAPNTTGLPLGAPASPFLFNIYCLAMDRRIGSYCEEQGMVYTRYLDDLTFSDTVKIGKKRRRNLRELIEETPGMVVNHVKSAVHSLATAPVTITGVSLYPDRHLGASPALLDTAHRTFTEIGEVAAAGLFVLPEEIGRLHGYRGAIHQLSPDETPTLRRLEQEYQAALGAISLAGLEG